MKFLAVLITIFLYRNWIGDHPLQGRVPFDRWQRWFFGSSLGVNIRYILCVGIPVLGVGWLAMSLDHGLTSILWLLLSLAVILYAADIYDSAAVFSDHRTWLRSLEESSNVNEAVQRHEDFMMLCAYEYFQSLFPVLFWYLILGPMGPLLYILSRFYLDLLDEDDPESTLVDSVIYWMEWFPVRVTGLILALLGSFAGTFERWLELSADFGSSNTVALTTMMASAIDANEYEGDEDLEEFITSAVMDTDALEAMLGRIVFGWLGLAAIIAIVGW
ncbi:MAG: regulatory signaling modulator protein AmpE [Pseudomonadales bacterium]|nr:regulatory signaling modulator protein AmpE [Pseudomonadales bacterium]